MVKKLYCEIDPDDYIYVEKYGEYVDILIVNDVDSSMVRLTPDAARKLRKQIKKAIEAIEGGEGKARCR